MLGPGNRSVSPCRPQVALKSRGQSRRRRPRPGPAGAGRLWKASGGHWQHGHSQTPVRERVVLRQPPPSFHTTPRWCLQNWPTGVRAPDPRAACVGGGPWETPATGPGGPTQAPRPTPTLETQAPSGGPTAGTPTHVLNVTEPPRPGPTWWQATHLVIAISMSIFSVGYSSQAARPRGQGDRWWQDPGPSPSPSPLTTRAPSPNRWNGQERRGPHRLRGRGRAGAGPGGRGRSPMFSGLNAATTSRRGHAFQ